MSRKSRRQINANNARNGLLPAELYRNGNNVEGKLNNHHFATEYSGSTVGTKPGSAHPADYRTLKSVKYARFTREDYTKVK